METSPPPEATPEATPEAPPVTRDATKVVSVPLMITSSMRTQLRAKGITEEKLRSLTPEQAHEILKQHEEKKTE